MPHAHRDTVRSISAYGYVLRIMRSLVDGVIVIEVDTPIHDVNAKKEPACRIYLNDACVHEGTPYPESEAV